MKRRVIDLSTAELSALGAEAAQRAASRAFAAGLPPSGTVEYFEDAEPSSRAEQSSRGARPRAEVKRAAAASRLRPG